MKVSIEVHGIPELNAKFDGVLGKMQRVGRESTYEFVGHASERAAVNAPIDTGYLRQHISYYAETFKQDKSTTTGYITVPYAFKMHELLLPFGAGPFHRGPRSREQPATPEGGVGGKYVERVLKFHSLKYLGKLGESVKKALS